MRDKLVKLVDTMRDLHRQLPGLTAVQHGVVEQRIEAVDREIDAVVYRQYGLSEAERELLEGGCYRSRGIRGQEARRTSVAPLRASPTSASQMAAASSMV